MCQQTILAYSVGLRRISSCNLIPISMELNFPVLDFTSLKTNFPVQGIINIVPKDIPSNECEIGERIMSSKSYGFQ